MDWEESEWIRSGVARELAHRPDLDVAVDATTRLVAALGRCFARGGRLYLAGNGGSAADCEHIAGELLKGFRLSRRLAASTRELLPGTLHQLQPGLPAVPLTGFAATRSAIGNDIGPELEFAQLVWALGRPGDCLLGLSTSGNSRNILLATAAAKSRGMTTLALTGAEGGALARQADFVVQAPAMATHLVQECHIAIYHAACFVIEDAFFGVTSGITSRA